MALKIINNSTFLKDKDGYTKLFRKGKAFVELTPGIYKIRFYWIPGCTVYHEHQFTAAQIAEYSDNYQKGNSEMEALVKVEKAILVNNYNNSHTKCQNIL